MDYETIAIMGGLVTPIYLSLFGIYRKIGFLDACNQQRYRDNRE
jgi:hypothetical protein